MATMTNTFKAAVGILVLSMIYLFAVTFTPDEYVNSIYANRIITYLQTIITLLIGYYWGTSTKNSGTQLPSETNPNETPKGGV